MIENIPSAFQVIETESALRDVARKLEKKNVVAVDLEADSMYHFKEKVCLIQIATKQESFAIDPLQIKALSDLKPLFSNPKIKKVLHGADYDVRSLYRDFHIEIKNLFDTELACRFLGIKETGLEAVIQKRFNVKLNKIFQKNDWSRRPLPDDMLEYAVIDVIYLIPLAEALERELRIMGRLEWLQEACKNLCNVRDMPCSNEPLFIRFKGAGKLEPRDLAVLETLLQFREKMARQKDKPLFKIIKNESVLKITRAKPITVKRLAESHALNKNQLEMYGDTLVDAVKKALKIPKDNLPVYPRKRVTIREGVVTKRAKALNDWRIAKARQLDLDPSLILNKSLLNTLALTNPRRINDLDKITDMKNWQKRNFGKALLEVIQRV